MGAFISWWSIRPRVLQPIHRPTQRYLRGFLHLKLMWPDTEKTPPKLRLKLIVYWTSCVRWRTRRTTKTEKSVSWRGQSVSLIVLICVPSFFFINMIICCVGEAVQTCYVFILFLLPCLCIAVKMFSVSAFDEVDVLLGFFPSTLSFALKHWSRFFLMLNGLWTSAFCLPLFHFFTWKCVPSVTSRLVNTCVLRHT